jgi:hypothetical protein
VFAPITFAMMAAGAVDDPGNVADTQATVDQIMAHDAKWERLCGR